MANKKRVIRLWYKILMQIGMPPIRLVFKNEWAQETGKNFGSSLGKAIRSKMLVGIRHHGREYKEIKNTLWHEIGHILFPEKPHWWIECYGDKMSNYDVGEGRYTKRYGHSPSELPSKKELLTMSRKAILAPEFTKMSKKHFKRWLKDYLEWLDQQKPEDRAAFPALKTKRNTKLKK